MEIPVASQIAKLDDLLRLAENVRIHKDRCLDLIRGCRALLVAIDEPNEVDKEMKSTLISVHGLMSLTNSRVREWATFGRARALMKSSEMKAGLDSLHRELESITSEFSTLKTVQLSRKVLQHQDPSGTLKNEFQNVGLRDDGKKGSSTSNQLSKPLFDLTGQVKQISERPIYVGEFSDVYQGTWLDSEKVALKASPIFDKNSDTVKRFKTEVEIWSQLHHPHVIRTYGTVSTENRVYSVNPWMNRSDEISYLTAYPKDRVELLAEVAAGLEYLHNNNIVHGDLRGANVLVTEMGSACLSDFGVFPLCAQLDARSTRNDFATSGMVRWQAPEILQDMRASTRSSDVWSYGMLCLELITERRPYADLSHDTAVLEIVSGRFPVRPAMVDDALWSLMRICWMGKDPGARPSMTHVKKEIDRLLWGAPTGQDKPLPLSVPVIDWTKFGKESVDVEGPSDRFVSKQRDRSESDPGTDALPTFEEDLAGEAVFGLSSWEPRRTAGEGVEFLPVAQLRDHPARTYTAPASTAASSFMSVHDSLQSWAPQSRYARSMASTAPTSVHMSTSSPLLFKPTLMQNYLLPGDTHLSSVDGEQFDDFEDHDPGVDDIIHYDTKDGSVSSGSLRGLISALVDHTCLPHLHENFENALLITYRAYMSSSVFFNLLVRRFNEVENGETAIRVVTHSRILTLLGRWLERHPTDSTDLELLREVQEFAENIRGPPSMEMASQEVMRLAQTLISSIEYPSPTLEPLHPIPRARDIEPPALAVALTLLEAKHLSVITPADVVTYLLSPRKEGKIFQSLKMTTKIVAWVRISILRPESAEQRYQALKFFINTAEECHRMNNYSSLAAITEALKSPVLTRLTMTQSLLNRRERENLALFGRLLEPDSYRVLRRTTKRCLPSLSSISHLELDSLVRSCRRPVLVDDQYLVDFKACYRAADAIRGLLDYTHHPYDIPRNEPATAFLDHHLEKIAPDVEDQIEKRSLHIQQGEAHALQNRQRELQYLGFRPRQIGQRRTLAASNSYKQPPASFASHGYAKGAMSKNAGNRPPSLRMPPGKLLVLDEDPQPPKNGEVVFTLKLGQFRGIAGSQMQNLATLESVHKVKIMHPDVSTYANMSKDVMFFITIMGDPRHVATAKAELEDLVEFQDMFDCKLCHPEVTSNA